MKPPPEAVFQYAAECPEVGHLLAECFEFMLNQPLIAQGLHHMARVGEELRARQATPVVKQAQILTFTHKGRN